MLQSAMRLPKGGLDAIIEPIISQPKQAVEQENQP